MSYPLTALISDLHSNRQALEVAVADAHARGARRYVCLGDLIGYGAEPAPCLDLVMQLCGPEPTDPDGQPLEPGLCLQGNHEFALLEGLAVRIGGLWAAQLHHQIEAGRRLGSVPDQVP
ncbi:MAG: metallophosphoesterase family protein, partial [Planctomycetota bacterium]